MLDCLNSGCGVDGMESYALTLMVFSVQLQIAVTDVPPKSVLHATFVPYIILGDQVWHTFFLCKPFY